MRFYLQQGFWSLEVTCAYSDPGPKYSQSQKSLHPKQYRLHAASQHDFTAEAVDWGFSQLIPLTQLNDPNNGFLHSNGTFRVKAVIKVSL